MDAEAKTMMRDEIAAIIRNTSDANMFSRSHDAATEIMRLLFAGQYAVTREGADYLEAHRLALRGGKPAPATTARRIHSPVVRDGVSYNLCVHGFRICSECGGPTVAG